MANFGTDIGAVPDLDPMMSEFTGRAVLVEALYRRYITPRGSLFYDPNYGYALFELLGDSLSASDLVLIQAEIAQEALKDERVAAARARCVYKSETRKLRVAVTLQDADGPFSLVLEADQVSVKILNGQVSSV